MDETTHGSQRTEEVAPTALRLEIVRYLDEPPLAIGVRCVGSPSYQDIAEGEPLGYTCPRCSHHMALRRLLELRFRDTYCPKCHTEFRVRIVTDPEYEANGWARP